MSISAALCRKSYKFRTYTIDIHKIIHKNEINDYTLTTYENTLSYEKSTYENYVQAFKKNFESHIDSLKKYDGSKENGTFLIEQVDGSLFIDGAVPYQVTGKSGN